MRNLFLLLHLAAAIVWMGGMAFLLLVLRPVLHAQLQPPARLQLVVPVLRRFFALVLASIALLLASGGWLLARAPAASAPAGWHAMAALGLVMVAVFALLLLGPWRGLQAAVAASDWPTGGRQMNRIARLAQLNFLLGWLAIAAVLLWP